MSLHDSHHFDAPEDGPARGVDSLSGLHTLLLSFESIDSFLHELALLASRTIAPPVSCGITVEYDGHPLTVGSSDERARALDESQYQVHEGPCLQAMLTGEVVDVPDAAQESRWPDYVSVARDIGLRSSLSLPLIVADRSVGALNLHNCEDAHVFDDGSKRAQAELFAAQASTALLMATRQARQSETTQQLEAALTSRSTIDQAVGILMSQQQCGPDEAFALLRAHSQNNNRKLREVAAQLVARTAGPGGAPPS